MRKFFIFLLSLLSIISVSACDTSTVYKAKTNNIDTNKYIIQTPLYQIYEEDTQVYRYKIVNGKNVLVDEIKRGTEPEIEEKGDGILRLFLGSGTNAFSVKYFNVYNGAISEEFNPYTIYADYVNTKTKEYFIAYFKHEQEPKLYIQGFFDSSDFSVQLDLNFSMATCEKIIFLNGTEIYIEYIDIDSQNIKKIVNFKETSTPQ